jgi:hypothetical protein
MVGDPSVPTDGAATTVGIVSSLGAGAVSEVDEAAGAGVVLDVEDIVSFLNVGAAVSAVDGTAGVDVALDVEGATRAGDEVEIDGSAGASTAL